MSHHNPKIQSLSDLAADVRRWKAAGKKVVHAHGVFDLLHIGHIRYFSQARKFGDVLIVTVTPDHFVNKGPHRPLFHETLRAEAIAALDSVDYVAINKWPTAVETIGMLCPDFYVKGPDYKDKEQDRTGGILAEEQAVQATGGQLVFTNDIAFSSTNLINREFPVFPKEVSDYLEGFAARHKLSDVFRPLENARPLKVLTVGESIIDEYQYCTAIGKSSKEPMVALKHQSTERFAGGILAVANHVAGFCDRVGVVSELGFERGHESFISDKLRSNIEKHFLYRTDSPTIVKRRFVESYFFTKLIEVYELNDSASTPADNQRLCDTLKQVLPEFDIVIVVDFGHGMITDEAVQALCNGARFLAVNTQSNAGNLGYHTISRYKRADYVCMAENEIRLEARDRRGDIKDMILKVSRELGARYMSVTRGKNGADCYSSAEGLFHVPAFAGSVVDRMGAGDGFISITSLCVAQNTPMEIVGFIGNAVGAQMVATVGNRTPVERVSLLRQIESLLK